MRIAKDRGEEEGEGGRADHAVTNRTLLRRHRGRCPWDFRTGPVVVR